MNNIVIVCDEKEVSDNLKSNLMLLRKFDYIISCNFLTAQDTIQRNNPAIILLHSNNPDDKVIDFIKEFKKIPILFISNEFSDETLLNVYDAGISDYIKTSQSQSEFLIKIMFCIKKSIETKKLERYSDILERIGIVNKNSGFYSKKYTPAVFKNLSEKYLQEKIKVSLMAVAQDINEKNKCSLEYMAHIFGENLRDDDLIGFGTDKLYFLLPYTTHQGALEVYNKIKKTIELSCTISAGILELEPKQDFKKILKILDEALEDALTLKNCAVVQEDLSDEPPMNWLDKKNKKHKNFKLFKKAFQKKLETVITPVFFQKQQIAEQRLFETEIIQFCGEKKSVFSLKKEDYHSFIEITYPGAVKIYVNVYENYKENPEPKSEVYDLSQLNEKLLGEIIDKLIRDFQKNT